MSAVVLYMSMSLDGFVAGPNQSVQNGLGDGGERLHSWIFNSAGVPDDLTSIADLGTVNQRVIDELMSTGAVITGRGTFEAAGAWGGDHHDGVPIFVLRRSPPEPRWAAFSGASFEAPTDPGAECFGCPVPDGQPYPKLRQRHILQ